MKNKEIAHDASLLGGAKKHLGEEIHRFMRIWVDAGAASHHHDPLLYIFGNLIGSRIGDMHGFSYMQFIVPGLIMMSVITNAYANVASSFLVPSSSVILKSCW